MYIRKADARNRALLFCLILSITAACAPDTSLIQPSDLPTSPVTAAPPPPNQGVPEGSTETVAVIPITGLENLSITACPDWDVNKMYEYGKYLYGFYCAGCHGREGQGAPFTSHFPPLIDSNLAVSEDIAYDLYYMMNTDIHPNATMLFEKDALAVINYVRITFASNKDLICPGEYVIEINP